MPWNYWGMSDVTIAKWVALTTLCLALVVLLAILVLRRLADAQAVRPGVAVNSLNMGNLPITSRSGVDPAAVWAHCRNAPSRS